MTATLWLLLAMIAALLASGCLFFMSRLLAKMGEDEAANQRKISRLLDMGYAPDGANQFIIIPDDLALQRDLCALKRKPSGCTANCSQGRRCTCGQSGKKP